jgi:hypothetical protein
MDRHDIAPPLGWRRFSAAAAAMVAGAAIVITGATFVLGPVTAAHADTTAPVVTTQPTDVTVPMEQSAVFTAAATGSTAVRWQRAEPGSAQFTDVAGATAPTDTTDALSSQDNNARYRAVFTNAAGSVTTNPATVGVQGLTAPAVVTQPAGVVASPGGTATFTAVVTGAPIPQVTWQRAAPGSDQFADIPGTFGYPHYLTNTLQAKATYTAGQLTVADSGARYRAVFSGIAGAVTSNPATLTVVSAPVITGDAPRGTIGTPYTFTYPITASPAASVSVVTSPAITGVSVLPGGTLSGTPQKAGTYSVTVNATNPYGLATRKQQLVIDPATTGQAKVTAPPASVQPGATESDTTMPVFAERQNQTLASNLTVGGTTIPAGTRVNSYYVHADAVGNVNVAHPFSGTVAFGDQVLAVATSTADLQATTPILGAAGTTYSTASDQGLEFDDSATVTAPATVSMNLTVYNTADAIRIITLAP